MTHCPVLPPRVEGLLLPLRELIAAMDERDRLPQIEVAVGDVAVALVLRHLAPLGPADLARLRAFGAHHGVQWWLQPKGPDSVQPLRPDDAELSYALPEFGVVIRFLPTDFTQVNGAINRVLVPRAVRLLGVQPADRVIDWFCGLGNFSLPLARTAAEVVGIEGSPALVRRAQDNARSNGLERRTRFEVRNLFETGAGALLELGAADRWLVDPPREGAFALAKALADLDERPAGGWAAPRRIVYVSCNPATLARDAGLLVHRGGYRLEAAGVVNMFPHTAHVEGVAVFDRARP
jgi:23S rRNA (uracil1939-C5)-methyltransferase